MLTSKPAPTSFTHFNINTTFFTHSSLSLLFAHSITLTLSLWRLLSLCAPSFSLSLKLCLYFYAFLACSIFLSASLSLSFSLSLHFSLDLSLLLQQYQNLCTIYIKTCTLNILSTFFSLIWKKKRMMKMVKIKIKMKRKVMVMMIKNYNL